MHNRCRMITAMYLTKDLMLDWRLGEQVGDFLMSVLRYSLRRILALYENAHRCRPSIK